MMIGSALTEKERSRVMAKEYIMLFDYALYNEDTGKACFNPKMVGELVRCKDCKYRPHWDEKTESAVFPIPDRCPCECDDYFYSWVPNDDWFCADGERREQ